MVFFYTVHGISTPILTQVLRHLDKCSYFSSSSQYTYILVYLLHLPPEKEKLLFSGQLVIRLEMFQNKGIDLILHIINQSTVQTIYIVSTLIKPSFPILLTAEMEVEPRSCRHIYIDVGGNQSMREIHRQIPRKSRWKMKLPRNTLTSYYKRGLASVFRADISQHEKHLKGLLYQENYRKSVAPVDAVVVVSVASPVEVVSAVSSAAASVGVAAVVSAAETFPATSSRLS